MTEPYNENGISLSPGDFKAAVEFMGSRPINVSIDNEGLIFENMGRKSIIAFNCLADINSFKDAHWTINQAELRDLAALIPSDTIFWDRRKLDLEFEVENYEKRVGHVQKSYKVIDKEGHKAYYQAREKLWAEDPEYRSLRRLEEEAKAHVFEFGAFFFSDKVEFYLSVNEVADIALLTVGLKEKTQS